MEDFHLYSQKVLTEMLSMHFVTVSLLLGVAHSIFAHLLEHCILLNHCVCMYMFVCVCVCPFRHQVIGVLINKERINKMVDTTKENVSTNSAFQN
jgi:hypothetical protein